MTTSKNATATDREVAPSTELVLRPDALLAGAADQLVERHKGILRR